MAAKTLEMSLQQISVLFQLGQVWPRAVLGVFHVQGDTSLFMRRMSSHGGAAPWRPLGLEERLP